MCMPLHQRASALHSTLFTANAHVRCGQTFERTTTMAIKAKFTAGVLSVTGGSGDDAIAITRDAAGQILINGGAISAQSAQEGQPTLTNANRIVVVGGAGNDTISLDNIAPPAGQALPQALPPATLFGGNGNDTLIGGDGDDILFGGNGDDT